MSVLKLVGSLMIIFAGGTIGFRVAEQYRQRPVQLRALQSSLMMLQTEINYAATPLPEALAHVAKRSDDSVRDLFLGTSKQLGTLQGLTASDAWNITLSEWKKNSPLKSGDISILQNLGGGLGTSDREEQEKHLVLIREQLRQEEIKAEQEKIKNEPIWKYAGVLTALFIVVLLF